MLVTKNIDRILHHAALGSVPRSIEDPIKSAEVNIMGSFNIFFASVKNNVSRVILACSSSTYGDSSVLPKVENIIGNPLSPYALTKLCLEQTAEIFHKNYGLEFIGLRYFNIFGPRQRPDSEYAAVIPKFCTAIISNISPTINGDGLISRDFTFIENVIQANSLALFTTNKNALNQIYNTACGESTNLNEIVENLNYISKKSIKPIYLPQRKGDVVKSLADISKISTILNYHPSIMFNEGIRRTYEWYAENFESNL
jgi:UDP-N-acetylglucosamine 4-epimerase